MSQSNDKVEHCPPTNDLSNRNDMDKSAIYWFTIPPLYKYVSLTNDGNIYGITEKYEVYYPSYTTSEWIKVPKNQSILENKMFKVPFSLKYFYKNNGKLYGINENGDIYYADYMNEQWSLQSNKLDNNDMIILEEKYKIDSEKMKSNIIKPIICNNEEKSSHIKCKNEYYTSKTWDKIPGKLKQVSLYNNVVCGVSTDNNVYCADNNNIDDPNWFQIKGSFIYVSLYSGGIYAIDKLWNIYHAKDYNNPIWVKEPLKLKYDIDILLPPEKI